jgi:hypothetical protein
MTAPTSGSTISGTATVSASASDNVGVASVQFVLDGALTGSPITTSPYSYSLNTTTLTNGTHTISAVAKDAAGNTGTSSVVSVTVSNSVADTTAPTVSVSAPVNGATVSGTTSITATASDNVGVSNVQYKIDGTLVGSAITTAPYTYSWNTSSIANGSHTIVAIAKDAAGNTGTSATITVTVSNATAPVISAISVVPSITTATLTFTTAPATTNTINYGTTASYGSSIVSGTATTAHTINFASLTPGTTYHYQIVSVASGLTTTSADQTFTTTTDTTAPTVSVSTPTSGATVSGSAVSITATASDNIAVANVQYKIDGTLVGSALTTSPYTYTWNTTGLSNGSHTVVAVAKDAAGNTGTSSTVTVTVSNAVAPVISAVASSGVTYNSATITWTTDQSTTSKVNYGTTTSYGSTSTSSSLLTAHTASLIGLAASTTYHFNIVATISAGLSTTSSDFTFTTPAAPDTTAPTVSVSAPATGSTVYGSAVSITASASDNVGVSNVQYKIDGTLVGSAITTAPYTYTWNTTSATNASHTIVAVAKDAAGNTGTSTTITVTVDNAGPTISGISVSGITSNGATIGWTTNKAATTQIVFGTTASYGSSSTFNNAQTTSHSVTLSALAASTTYHYAVQSISANNVLTTSADQTFTTSAAPDTIAPTVSITAPTNGSTVSGSAVSVTASASDNVSVTSVQFIIDGTLVGSPITAAPYAYTWNVSALSNGTHTVSAIAKDAAGNSGTSSVVSVTVNNSVAPIISGVATSSITYNNATVTFNTDQATTTQIQYGTTTAYGSTTSSAQLLTAHTMVIAGLAASTTYHFRIVSTIAAGLSTTSADFTFTTSAAPDTTAPTVSVTAPTSGSTLTGSVSLSANASDNVGVASVQFTVDGAAIGTIDTASPYTYTLDTSTLSSGAHTIGAIAKDAAGNTGTATAISITVDNAGPVISGVSTTGITYNSATINWTTDKVATTQVVYGTTASYGSTSTFVSTQTTSHSVSLTGLAANTTYHYAVKSISANNILTTSADFTFTTPSAPDTTAPAVSITAPVAGTTASGSVSLTASASDNVGITSVQFTVDGSPVGSALTTAPYSYTLNTSSLTDGTHTISAIAKDAAGNTGTATAVSISTLNTGSTISGVSVTGITQTGATLNWTTSQPTYSQILFGTTAAYGNTTTSQMVYTTSHSFPMSGLIAGTTYHYEIIAINSSGISATAPDATFTTLAAPDTTAPTVSITNPTSGATLSGSNSITAIASDNVGVTTVQFQIDGTLVGSVDTATPYAYTWDTTTATNGTHTISAIASDAAGNATTAASVSVTVNNTTTPPNPTVPAVISAVNTVMTSSTTETLTFNTDQTTSNQIQYGTTTNYNTNS